MRFGENFMNEIKSRIRVSDVVSKHVKLKRQGREFSGLSPFTSEKTPSFFVNDEKGFYHCFSSGKARRCYIVFNGVRRPYAFLNLLSVWQNK